MAHDAVLAGRIRAVVADTPGAREEKMFGGLAFFTNGNLATSA